MKWERLYFCLLVIMAVLGGVFAYNTGTAKALDSQTVTVTANPRAPGEVGVPTAFTATYVDDSNVLLTWTKGYSSNTTLILAKYNGYSENATDGYVVYSGTGETFNDTFINYDTNLGTVYYTAIAYSTDNVSPTYATAELESPHVSTLATNIATLAAWFGSIFELILVLSLLIVSLWVKDMANQIVLSFISGIVTMIVGLLWIDDYVGVSIALFFLAAFQIGWRGLVPALSWGGPARGYSQFKGIVDDIKGRINNE